MKTKNFILFSTSVFAISFYIVVVLVYHSQPPQSIQNIVSQTHQHLKDFQENLRDEEESNLVEDERYLRAVGLEGPIEVWHNTTVPALVSAARDQPAAAVAWLRAARLLPYSVLLYDLGLAPASRAEVAGYCNTSKCAIVDFDLSVFPPHVTDENIHAYRPLVIQHALSRVGGVVWAEAGRAWRPGRGRGALGALWARAARRGVVAWGRRAAVTSLTHPRMFHYLRARPDDFLFVQMLDASRLLLADTPAVRPLMRTWVQCALTQDCIMPIGAQSDGCRFDKKPQYRYSGCHGADASALSILVERSAELRGAGDGGGLAWSPGALRDRTRHRVPPPPLTSQLH